MEAAVSGKQQFKRSNEARRAAAQVFIRGWYKVMAQEGRVQYLSDGQKRRLYIPADVVPARDTLAQAKKDRPENWRGKSKLTAHGVDTRTVLPGAFGIPHGPDSYTPTVSKDWHAEGVEAPAIIDANETMRFVAMICLEARLVLEMWAAAWDYPDISTELGCGEQTARGLFEAGLAYVISHRYLSGKAGFFYMRHEVEQ